jgi:RNA polymerase sigma-54 factor
MRPGYGLKLTTRPELRLIGLQILNAQILEYSEQKLEEELEDALADNPLLERLDAPTTLSQSRTEGEGGEMALSEAGSMLDWPGGHGSPGLDWPEERTPVSMEERDPLPLENFASVGTSLSDHLMAQLGVETSDEQMRIVAEAIIGNLDDNGRLDATLDEISAQTGAALPFVSQALALVQTFDPMGVAARDLREQLLLQLRADPDGDPLAIEIVDSHLRFLVPPRYQCLAKALRQPVARIEEALAAIRALDPKPCRRFGTADARPVRPDLTVDKVGEEYTVTVNDRGLPTLRIARGPIPSSKWSGLRDRRLIPERRRAAHGLLEAIEQRRRTLQWVGESLVRFQRGFFDHGPSHLCPLTLRQVADDISMHESTISRATNGKYMDTPRGLVPLKYFFQQGIPSADGDLIATRAIKEALEALVASEDRGRPHSDAGLAAALRGRGFPVARRTVAKYREELGIGTSHHRKAAPARV